MVKRKKVKSKKDYKLRQVNQNLEFVPITDISDTKLYKADKRFKTFKFIIPKNFIPDEKNLQIQYEVIINGKKYFRFLQVSINKDVKAGSNLEEKIRRAIIKNELNIKNNLPNSNLLKQNTDKVTTIQDNEILNITPSSSSKITIEDEDGNIDVSIIPFSSQNNTEIENFDTLDITPDSWNLSYSNIPASQITKAFIYNPQAFNPKNNVINSYKKSYSFGKVIHEKVNCLKVVISEILNNKYRTVDIPDGGLTTQQAINLFKDNNKSIRFLDKKGLVIAEHIATDHKKILTIFLVDHDHIEVKTNEFKIKNYKFLDTETYIKTLRKDLDTHMPMIKSFDKHKNIITSYQKDDILICEDPLFNFRESYKIPDNEKTLSHFYDKFVNHKNFLFRSNYNDQTYNIQFDLKYGGIVENYHKGEDLFIIDKNKFYTNIINSELFDIPIFDIQDEILDFDNSKKPGLYYVPNIGWKMLHTILFHNYKPTKQIIASKSMSIKVIKQIFKDIFTESVCKTEVDKSDTYLPNHSKVINMIIGRMQTDTNMYCEYLACETVAECNYYKNENSTIYLMDVGKDIPLPIVCNATFKCDMFNNKMVAGAIIEMSHILMLKLKYDLELLNKKIYEIRTDSFLIDNIEFIDESFLKKHNVKIEHLLEKGDSKKIIYKKANTKYMTIPNSFCKNEYVKEIKIIDEDIQSEIGIDIDFSKEYKTIQQCLINCESFLITGEAGTGKSYTITNIIEPYLIANNLKYLKGAFTNTAAENIGGETLNNLFNIAVDGNYYQNAKFPLTQIDYLIIDEFTQVPFNFYRELYTQKYKNLKIILVGDSYQLNAILPVEYTKIHNIKFPNNKKDMIYKDYDLLDLQFIKELTNNNIIKLTEVRRIGSNSVPILYAVEKTDLKKLNADVILAYNNKDVDMINNYMFNQYGNNKMNNGVQLKDSKTNKRYYLKNKLLIPFGKGLSIPATPELLKDFQLAFCITIFQSQGQGYTKMVVYNFQELTGKTLYVCKTRRQNTEIIFNLSFEV